MLIFKVAIDSLSGNNSRLSNAFETIAIKRGKFHNVQSEIWECNNKKSNIDVNQPIRFVPVLCCHSINVNKLICNQPAS